MSPPVSYTKLDLLPHGVDRQGEEVPRLRDAIRRSQTSGSQIRRFPQRSENLLDQKRTTDCVQKVLYHCSLSCIKLRHPYFKSHELTVAHTVAQKLTVDDVQTMKCDGEDLCFVLPRAY